MDLGILTQFIDANKIGGWVRAGVAALLVALVAKYPPLGTILDPSVQTQLAALIATVAVGLWSQLTNTDKAKLVAAAGVVDPTTGKPTIIVTSQALADATPAHDNIVSHQDVKVVQS